jgi:methoxymalonate biosynthesis acyl carrier protein
VTGIPTEGKTSVRRKETSVQAKERIRGFLTARCGQDLRDDDDIFEVGLVNSLLALQLVLFIEQEFGMQVRNEDLDRHNFRSVDAITQLVERYAG